MQKIKFAPGEYHKVMAPAETENYKIVHRVMDKEFVKNEIWKASFGGLDSYGEVVGLTPGTYVVMSDRGGNCIMSDTWMEVGTNREVMQEAHGEVLLGGLGIGLVPYHLQFKEAVDRVTIIEKEPEIIEMISNANILNGKIEVIEADIFDWEPPKGKLYNIIFFDIWSSISSDNWEGMKALTKKFKYKVDRNGNWMLDCWRKDKVQRLAREDRACKYYW